MAAIKYYRKKTTIDSCLKGGVLAGVFATVLNNIFTLIYLKIIDESFPEFLNFKFITILSFSACILSCIAFYLLSKFIKRPTLYFYGLVFLVTLASLIPALQPLYPDGTLKPKGFPGVAIPMHIFTAVICMYLVPVIGRVKSNR